MPYNTLACIIWNILWKKIICEVNESANLALIYKNLKVVHYLLDFKQVEKHKARVLVTQQNHEHKELYAALETSQDEYSHNQYYNCFNHTVRMSNLKSILKRWFPSHQE